MYWSSILFLLTWPLLIAISYFAIDFTLKKLSLLEEASDEE